LSRYFSKIVLGLLIAAPLVLVPSFSANAADATAPTSAPTQPNVPTTGHVAPPANPVTPQKPPTMKDPRNDVLPPGVVPLGPGPGAYHPLPMEDGAPTPYDLLDVRVNALSTSLKWMAAGNFVLLVMVISLLVRGRKTRQRSEPDPQPTYKLN
jgi:hypothetical protein